MAMQMAAKYLHVEVTRKVSGVCMPGNVSRVSKAWLHGHSLGIHMRTRMTRWTRELVRRGEFTDLVFIVH